ncbi:MAG: hypothetical protein ACJAXR_000744 [Halopseudomonas sp.]|jgi:hypothetical protein
MGAAATANGKSSTINKLKGKPGHKPGPPLWLTEEVTESVLVFLIIKGNIQPIDGHRLSRVTGGSKHALYQRGERRRSACPTIVTALIDRTATPTAATTQATGKEQASQT